MNQIVLDGVILHPYLGSIEHENQDCSRVLETVAYMDRVRIDSFGGYPSAVMFIYGTNGGEVWPELVAVASVDGSREPTISVMTPREFIDNHAPDPACADQAEPIP